MNAHSHPPALEELLVHSDWAWRLARSLVRDDQQADDVAQETWIAALRHPPDATADGAAATAWLARVVRHAAARLSRTEHRRTQRERIAARPEALPAADRVLERESARRHLVQAVLALSEPYRTAILLRYFEELSPREVAKRLGANRSTVRNHIHRGLELLRARLTSESAGERGSWLLALAPLIPKSSTTMGAAALGTTIMSTKTAAAVLSAVALVAGGWWMWRIADLGSKRGQDLNRSAAVAAANPPDGEAALAAASATFVDARQVVDPPASAPAVPAVPPAQIRVHVVDRDGLPVRGAELWIGQEWGEDSSPAGRSGPDGSFEAPRPHESAFVGARHPDHAPSFQVQVPEPGTSAGSVELELMLPGPGGSCSLTVLGARSQPVAGAKVRFGNWNPNTARSSSGAIVRPAPGWLARTDTEGRALVRGLAPEHLQLTIDAPTFEPWSGYCTIRAGEETNFTVTLSSGATVRGNVVDPSNQPLEGVEIWAGPREPRARGVSTKTDASGHYVLEGVPDGEMRLKALSRGLGEASEDLVVHLGESITWNVVLRANPAIRGRILDEAGQPLEGWKATITAPSDRGHWIRSDTTDAEGRFELRDPPGDLVDLEVYRAGFHGGGDVVVVVPGVRSGDAELTVRVRDDQMPTAFVSGRILYADGEPCAKAVVAYKAIDLPFRFSQAAEPDGSFRIGPIRPVTYDVLVSENELSLEHVAQVSARSGSTAELGEIRIARPGTLVVEPTPDVVDASLTYYVGQVGADGRPVFSDFRFEPAQGLSLRPGDYILQVRGSRYQSEDVSCRVSTGAVTVVSLPLISRMDLTLDFIARDAATLQWIDFEIRGFHDDSLAHHSRVTADEQGLLTARFELVPGVYKVSAVADNGYRGRINALSWGGPQTRPIQITLSGQ